MIVSTWCSVPSRGDDRALADLGDRVGDEIDVVLLERGQVVVGDQHALAAHAVVAASAWRAARGRATCCARWRRAIRSGRCCISLGCMKPSTSARGPSRSRRAAAAAGAGTRAYSARSTRGSIAWSGWGMIHGGVRWKTFSCATSGWMLRHELDRRRAGADDRDALAREVVVVVPLGRVEGVALEALDALELGDRRLAQAADAGDEHVGLEGPCEVSSASARAPRPSPRRSTSHSVCRWRRTSKSVGAALQVGADLRLRREGAAPVGVRREREGVQVRGHVALAAGIGVDVPGAADVVARARARRSPRGRTAA